MDFGPVCAMTLAVPPVGQVVPRSTWTSAGSVCALALAAESCGRRRACSRAWPSFLRSMPRARR
eukprot:3251754-Pyramimonas_sp.AAC.1